MLGACLFMQHVFLRFRLRVFMYYPWRAVRFQCRSEWPFDNYYDDYMPKENMMLWLIDEYPQALIMSSNGKGRKHSVSTMVVDSYNHNDNKKHLEIVGRVVNYADVDDDIYGIVPETGGETILAHARRHGNNLFLEFFRNQF